MTQAIASFLFALLSLWSPAETTWLEDVREGCDYAATVTDTGYVEACDNFTARLAINTARNGIAPVNGLTDRQAALVIGCGGYFAEVVGYATPDTVHQCVASLVRANWLQESPSSL